MSIYNDPRKNSDNPEEVESWEQELKWEARRENYIDEWEEYEDLVIESEDE